MSMEGQVLYLGNYKSIAGKQFFHLLNSSPAPACGLWVVRNLMYYESNKRTDPTKISMAIRYEN